MKSLHIYACALVLSGSCLVTNPLSGIGKNPFSGNAVAMKQQACKTYSDYDQALRKNNKQIATYEKKYGELFKKKRGLNNIKGFVSNPEIAELKVQVDAERVALKLNLKLNGFSEDDAEYFIREKIENKFISTR